MAKKIAKKKPVAEPVTEPVVLTQTDRIRLRLDEIKPNITTGDRRVAREILGLSKSTISKYLSGQLLDAETALELLTFFENRVTAREERLKALSI